MFSLGATFRPLVLIAFAIATQTCFAQEESGKVVGVSDGDTIKVLSGKTTVRVRLYGIDAPESRQAFGTQAKKKLSGLVFGKDVTLKVMATDRYGRKVCKVYIGETYVNAEMIQEGFAWHFKKYAPKEEDLANAEVAAKGGSKGLWADAKPVAPWEFRHAPANPALGYWLNTSSGVRHNNTCRSFQTTKAGRECKHDEGRACGSCGG